MTLPGPGPWGFRLQGGKDFNMPLTISRVGNCCKTICMSPGVSSCCFCSGFSLNDSFRRFQSEGGEFSREVEVGQPAGGPHPVQVCPDGTGASEGPSSFTFIRSSLVTLRCCSEACWLFLLEILVLRNLMMIQACGPQWAPEAPGGPGSLESRTAASKTGPGLSFQSSVSE